MAAEDPIARFRASLAEGWSARAACREVALPQDAGRTGREYRLVVYGPDGGWRCQEVLLVTQRALRHISDIDRYAWGALVHRLEREIVTP